MHDSIKFETYYKVMSDVSAAITPLRSLSNSVAGSEDCTRGRMGCSGQVVARTVAYNISSDRLPRVSTTGIISCLSCSAAHCAPAGRVAPRLNQMIKDVFVPFLTGIEYEGEPLEAPTPISW